MLQSLIVITIFIVLALIPKGYRAILKSNMKVLGEILAYLFEWMFTPPPKFIAIIIGGVFFYFLMTELSIILK